MKSFNPYYDIKTIAKTMLTIAIVFAGMMATGGAFYALVVPLALYAMFMNRHESLLFWVVFSNALICTNFFFAPKDMVFAISIRVLFALIGLYGVIGFCSIRIPRIIAPLMGIMFYLVYMFIPSAQGWAPSISIMKLGLFISTYLAFAYVASKAATNTRLDMRKIRSVVLALSTVYIIGSVLVLPFPGISMMNAEELLNSGSEVVSLYKGMANHSQTLGMFTCFWMIFLLADLAYNIQKADKLYVLLLVCGFFLVVQSGTRTAMGSLLAVSCFVAWTMLRARGIRMRWKSKVFTMTMGLLAVTVGLVLALPNMRDRVAKFVMKYDTAADAKSVNFEDAVKTRAGLVDSQMYNFRRRPAIGWGFQVSEDTADFVARSGGGLVLSAPIEKGVWVSAILEEGGILGELLYCVYALAALGLLLSRKAYMGASMFVLIHVSNLGEFTMFAMSGAGGMWYALLFFALVFDAKRLEGMRRPMVPDWGRGRYLQ